MTTPNIELPEFGTAGVPSGRDLTLAMRRLDAVVQLTVSGFETTPPVDPQLGDRVIVASPATGVFANHELHVAFYSQDGWSFFVPRHGWQAVVGVSSLVIFNEEVPAWVPIDIDFYSPATTKGDLLVYDGTTLVRLGVGANDTVLKADNTQAAGLKWGTGGGGAAANIDADTHPTSPNAADDEFEIGSTIDTAGTRFSGATAWTAFSLVTGTTLVQQGSLSFRPALQAARNLGGYTHPVSGSWGYTCKISIRSWSTNTLLGMFIATSSGASGNIIVFGFNGANLIVQRLTNSTTFSSNSSSTAGQITTTTTLLSGFAYLRITYDGTNLRFWLSWSGIEDTFNQIYTETSAAFLGTPALIGIGGDNESVSVQSRVQYDWFRKTS